jgi:hypothetical protein
VGRESGLIHKRHRRGKKRRDKERLALRVALSTLLIGIALALSVGIVHVVERPVPPFKAMAEEEASARAPAPGSVEAIDPQVAERQPGS